MANERARWLRKNMTPQEVKLWVQLRYMKQSGFHFRRQAPIESFIVDFLEKKKRLVIEVDGSQHGEPVGEWKDAARVRCLSGLGYRILRFWNFQIDTNMEGVIDTILYELAARTPTRLASLATLPASR